MKGLSTDGHKYTQILNPQIFSICENPCLSVDKFLGSYLIRLCGLFSSEFLFVWFVSFVVNILHSPYQTPCVSNRLFLPKARVKSAAAAQGIGGARSVP
jgi:hypothetical protein